MALQRAVAALSPKINMTQHPKFAVKWRPGTKGFFKAKYGASKMKWQFKLPYVREVDSLHHYPEISRITGKPINWYHDEPEDGYEGLRIFGENTIELKGMPLGRTPEYMQERLRRFFSKFGPVKHCRAEPHSHDPYQCEGTAWITFRDRDAAFRALRAPLKFPASLHDKVVSMRHLETDKRNDPDYHEKSKFWNSQILAVLKQLHGQLLSNEEFRTNGKPLAQISLGLLERELVPLPIPALSQGRGGVPMSKGLEGAPSRLVTAGPSVMRRFGSWEALLTEVPFDELFVLQRRPPAGQTPAMAGKSSGEAARTSCDQGPGQDSDDGTPLAVFPRLVTAMQRARILRRGQNVLAERLHAEFSVWWREGRVQLPEYTQRRVMWWDHKPSLPWELQIMSRTKDRFRIFDEKYLLRQQLKRARNEKRKLRRADYNEERKKALQEQDEARMRRKERAQAAIDTARCNELMGRSRGFVAPGIRS